MIATLNCPLCFWKSKPPLQEHQRQQFVQTALNLLWIVSTWRGQSGASVPVVAHVVALTQNTALAVLPGLDPAVAPFAPKL
jgi:hypothetical protein